MLEFPQHTRLVYHGLPGGETVTFWSLLVHFRALQRNPRARDHFVPGPEGRLWKEVGFEPQLTDNWHMGHPTVPHKHWEISIFCRRILQMQSLSFGPWRHGSVLWFLMAMVKMVDLMDIFQWRKNVRHGTHSGERTILVPQLHNIGPLREPSKTQINWEK